MVACNRNVYKMIMRMEGFCEKLVDDIDDTDKNFCNLMKQGQSESLFY